jgi:DNA-directed RNA polymerase subunit M/transcription elongation factor TFIIS
MSFMQIGIVERTRMTCPVCNKAKLDYYENYLGLDGEKHELVECPKCGHSRPYKAV